MVSCWNVLFCRLQMEVNIEEETEHDAEDFFDVELFIDKR